MLTFVVSFPSFWIGYLERAIHTHLSHFFWLHAFAVHCCTRCDQYKFFHAFPGSATLHWLCKSAKVHANRHSASCPSAVCVGIAANWAQNSDTNFCGHTWAFVASPFHASFCLCSMVWYECLALRAVSTLHLRLHLRAEFTTTSACWPWSQEWNKGTVVLAEEESSLSRALLCTSVLSQTMQQQSSNMQHDYKRDFY